jgi:hypothetical protein
MLKKGLCMTFALALNLFAADLTGTWKGTASQDDNVRR